MSYIQSSHLDWDAGQFVIRTILFLGQAKINPPKNIYRYSIRNPDNTEWESGGDYPTQDAALFAATLRVVYYYARIINNLNNRLEILQERVI